MKYLDICTLIMEQAHFRPVHTVRISLNFYRVFVTSNQWNKSQKSGGMSWFSRYNSKHFPNISQNHSLILNVFIIILLKVTIVTIEIISFIPSLVYGMLLTQLTSFVVISAIWLRLKRQLKNSYLTFKVMAIEIRGRLQRTSGKWGGGGGGVVLKLRTFPDGVVCESSDVRKCLKKSVVLF